MKGFDMKRVLLVAAFALVASVSLAKEANVTVVRPGPAVGSMTDYTPFKLTIVGPVALPPGTWDVKGLEIGIFNWTDRLEGLQIGIVNMTDAFSGLQFGVINHSRDAYGMQIGVINLIESCDCPFLPLINWNF